MLPKALRLTYGRLERLVRREIAERDPAGARVGNRRARRDRHVTAPRAGYDGMASMEVYGPGEDLAALHTAILALGDATCAAAQAAARDNAGTVRAEAEAEAEGIHALRFDALINLACAALADDTLPTRQGPRPSIQLTVPAATLLGISDAPGDLDGHGPIDADTARAIAFDRTATWRRILTDPQGRVLDYGTTTYRPPRALRDLVIARDRTCTSPGCSRPARTAQLDHNVPFPEGPTSEGNMDAKCGVDHNLKTAGLLTAERDPETGETTWTDRHGTSYTRPPKTMPTAPDTDDRLLAVISVLQSGRHRIADIPGAANHPGAANRRSGRVRGSTPAPPSPVPPAPADDPPPF